MVHVKRQPFTGTINFERTHDILLVREILITPSLYRAMRCDGTPEPQNLIPLEDESLWYVLAFDGTELLGLFALHPRGCVCWEVHVCLLPSAVLKRGRPAAALSQLFQWAWENIGCYRIIGNVPSFNRLALQLARRTRMIEFGCNEHSFLRNGQFYSEIMLGINRPEAT